MSLARRSVGRYRKPFRRGGRSVRPRRKAKRTIRRRRTYRRRRTMSTRKVLNITSRKKCDNMMPIVVAEDSAVTTGPYASPSPLLCLFVPNARTTRTPVTNPAVRNSSDIFAVGYKEKVRIDIRGGATFMWRRIVFMLKGDDLRRFMDSSDAGNIPNQLYDETVEGGCRRVIGPLQGVTNAQTELQKYVFRGQADVDWSDQFTAPLDTRRITVKSDRVRTIRPGNASGASRHYKMWYPIRRTISYEDDMESDVVGDRAFSTAGLRGVGDMYVMDIMGITNGNGQTPLTEYTFSPEGAFYWHEC